jgi:hypothetical protein
MPGIIKMNIESESNTVERERERKRERGNNISADLMGSSSCESKYGR